MRSVPRSVPALFGSEVVPSGSGWFPPWFRPVLTKWFREPPPIGGDLEPMGNRFEKNSTSDGERDRR